MIKKRIKNLKDTFKKFDIDGYVIPKNDEYFTEYSKINRLKIIAIPAEPLKFDIIFNLLIFEYSVKYSSFLGII